MSVRWLGPIENGHLYWLPVCHACDARCLSADAVKSRGDKVQGSWQQSCLQGKINTPKTKLLVQALERLGVGQEDYGLLILNEPSAELDLSARNVEKLKVNTVTALNVYDILRADKIVIEQSAFNYIQQFYGAKQEADDVGDASTVAVSNTAEDSVTN